MTNRRKAEEAPGRKELKNGETLVSFQRKCHCGPKLRDGGPGEICLTCGGAIPEARNVK